MNTREVAGLLESQLSLNGIEECRLFGTRTRFDGASQDVTVSVRFNPGLGDKPYEVTASGDGRKTYGRGATTEAAISAVRWADLDG